MGAGTWSKSRCGERKGEEDHRLERFGKGKMGEKLVGHEDSQESCEMPQRGSPVSAGTSPSWLRVHQQCPLDARWGAGCTRWP